MTAGACDACLRRSHVIATLAARIEGLLQGPNKRVSRLLALPVESLLDALVPADRRGEAEAQIAAFEPDDARAAAKEASLESLCKHAHAYPNTFHELPDAPPVVWVRGGVDRLSELLAEPAVAIVGTRRPSAYGTEVAQRLGRGLSAAGVTVISGLALGIDAAAHRGALATPRPRTLAVLGGGADVIYPRVHAPLYDAIAGCGVILSESPPGRRPFRWTFPARNRLMAALAAMTIVVEAAEPSGSLITAAFAADLGRAVAAVPGRVTSANAAGSNRLLRDGAALVRDPADVLDELFGVGGADRLANPAGGPAQRLSREEEAVLRAVEDGADAGAIAAGLGVAPARVRALLGVLEASGLVRRTGIGSYERTAAA